jgi:glycosidase
MAVDTPKYFRNLVIYEIYVRNHGPDGNFADVISDLQRIKSMGTDVIWLMPVNPIGSKNKKGNRGCPYSIQDYREINPEYGNLQDFGELIDTAHSLDLKVMIDIVFNHTSHDSVLVNEHPEWFFSNDKGRPVPTVPDWEDVIDLKFPNDELEEYLTDTLKIWVNRGVDGFRCDAASLIPVDFWMNARKSIGKIKPDFIWLAESVDARWIAERREMGYLMWHDNELYNAFDITYDYDIWPVFHAAVRGTVKSHRYAEMLKFQDCVYPHNYIKLRCVENHDRKRILNLAGSADQAVAWTAFQAFNKGAFLIYAGQESANKHNPSLFDIDKIEWGEYELQELLTKLSALKKDKAQTEGKFHLINSSSGLQAAWIHPHGSLYGIFNTDGEEGNVEVSVEDGIYTDSITGKSISIKKGIAGLPESFTIFPFNDPVQIKPFKSVLLDID